MKSRQFYPGETVMVLLNQEDIPVGSKGMVTSRFLGSLYAVRTPEGRIHWMERGELDSINPNRHRLLEGDLARVISSGHDHSFLHRGDLVEILKIIEEVDYYKVLIEDELHWLNGLELAAYQLVRMDNNRKKPEDPSILWLFCVYK